MALTKVQLKDNVFLTLEDVKDWLKISDDACVKDTGLENRVMRMMNSAADMCERYVGGPIKSRQYVEFRDGDSSNTLVLDYYPIREVSDLRVDFNRAFTDPTIVKAGEYIIRGTPDPSFPGKIRGTDLVLRDDNDTSIVGRIFTGSTVGSIKITYTAGWGANQDEIPSDLVNAVLMTIEFYYMLRETRDMNTKSKSVNGQTTSRVQGLPKEVTDILDSYVDYTLGRNNRPQTNTFTL